jgi:hypothetical protein
MPISDTHVENWKSSIKHHRRILGIGGTLLPVRKRRPLTDIELQSGTANDRQLSQEERKQRKLLCARVFSEAELDEVKQKLGHLTEVYNLPKSERDSRILEEVSIKTDELLDGCPKVGFCW